jgi:pimeloyl-ACP methyl ester carboxylesterase
MARGISRATLFGAAWLMVAGCSDDGNSPDLTADSSTVGRSDASTTPSALDAGGSVPDARAPVADTGTSTVMDATSSSGNDAATASNDANTSPASEASTPDAGPTTDGSVQEPAPHPGDLDKSILPIVFLHGLAGSASQFDSQAQRFVANGYPPSKLHAFDHDGEPLSTTAFVEPLDQLVSSLLTKFGVSKVILIGHSRGTGLVNGYIGSAARAGKVSKIVLLDGSACGSTVPCDAPNRDNLPGQAHVEVATSPESFKRQYKFLLGKDPTVVDITAQTEPVLVSGRAVNFPANTGRSGATLNVYELGADGQRAGAALLTKAIDASGDFGPVQVSPEKYYELALTLENGFVQHLYFQRFLRSTKFIRLLSGPIDSPSRMNTNGGPNHAALTLMRMREWFTTDTLQIQVTRASGEPTNVPNAFPAAIANDSIAVYLHDDKATPGTTTLQPLPYFPAQFFQTGFDVFMPAAEEPNGTITVTNQPRGNTGKPQVLKMPNWASSKHSMTLNFTDYAQ